MNYDEAVLSGRFNRLPIDQQIKLLEEKINELGGPNASVRAAQLQNELRGLRALTTDQSEEARWNG